MPWEFYVFLAFYTIVGIVALALSVLAGVWDEMAEDSSTEWVGVYSILIILLWPLIGAWMIIDLLGTFVKTKVLLGKDK